MNIGDLIKIGMNKNEARVYLALIGFGKADANHLIRETKFHKNIIYDNLEKLIDKGLVTYITEGNKRIFQIAPPNILRRFFDEQQEELDEKKKLANQISKEIEEVKNKELMKQDAQIYRGVKAIKSFYDATLHTDFYVFGAPQESIDIMGEVFWENYVVKRKKSKIRTRMIFNPSIRYFGEKIKDSYTKIKYFDRDFEPLTETHIQEDKVAIIVWSREPMLFLIKDKNVADSYMKYFNSMWKLARK